MLKHLKSWREGQKDIEAVDEDMVLMHVIKHPDLYYPFITETYNKSVCTTKNMLTLILALYKAAALKCDYAETYAKWKEYHGVWKQKEEGRYNTNKPTDAQEEKHISFQEIHAEVKRILRSEPHASLQWSLESCMLCMYTGVIPKRSDFGQIRVYSFDKKKTDKNYLVPGREEGDEAYFMYNTWSKTHKHAKVKQQRQNIDNKMRDVFRASMAKYPRKYLFVGKDMQPMTNRAYGRFVIATFKNHFGKSVGVSMLRHLFVNEKIDLNKMTVEEKDNVAAMMGHSRRQQEQYKLFFNPKEG